MSYTYLLGQEAESSAECFSDIAPYVRSRLSLTAEKSCCNGNGTEFCPGSRSGMTCEHSTAGPGAESSMSSAADSHARTSAQPEKGQESTANAPDSGAKWPGSLAKFDPDTRSWKTRQCLLLGGLEEFSETFPKWGSMHDGELFRQPTPVLRTCGKGSGFWPTPDTRGFTNDGAIAALAQVCESMDELSGMTHRAGRTKKAKAVGSVFRSQATATTTATVLFADSNTQKSADAPARQWTTTNTSNETESCSPGLLPTPKNRDWKGQTQRGIHGPGDSIANLDRGDGKPIGGQLNPNWVEWLMGWPIGWTDLKPLETDKFRLWLRSHGGF
jgi:hypothetical protein